MRSFDLKYSTCDNHFFCKAWCAYNLQENITLSAVQEQRDILKMATGNLVPGNPQLALVTYNKVVVWPPKPPSRAGPFLFTQIRSQYAGEDLYSPDDIAYSREELLQLRPVSSPSINFGLASMSIL